MTAYNFITLDRAARIGPEAVTVLAFEADNDVDANRLLRKWVLAAHADEVVDAFIKGGCYETDNGYVHWVEAVYFAEAALP